MIYRLRLKGLTARQPGFSANWDSETGVFTGPSAERGRAIVASAQRDGSASPIPCLSYPIGKDISPQDLAMILATRYRVGDALPFPEIIDDTEDGDVN